MTRTIYCSAQIFRVSYLGERGDVLSLTRSLSSPPSGGTTGPESRVGIWFGTPNG